MHPGVPQHGHAMQRIDHSRGFSFVEQIATLAVAAILVAIAVPSMAHLVASSATRTAEDALFTAAHLARSQAIMHNTHVLLCPSKDGLHCDTAASWEQGWIVAADRDRDNQPDGAILAHGTPDTTHVRLLGSSGRPRVRFRADGAAAGTNITLLICPRHDNDGQVRSVVISNTGRIREAKASHARAARCRAAD